MFFGRIVLNSRKISNGMNLCASLLSSYLTSELLPVILRRIIPSGV